MYFLSPPKDPPLLLARLVGRVGLALLALFLLLEVLLLGELLVLLLDQRDERGAAALELGRGPGLDEPVEPERGRVPHLAPEPLEAVVALVANLLQHADQETVLLLGEVLAAVLAVLNPKLLERLAVPSHLGGQRVLDILPPEVLLLAALDGGDVRLVVLDLREPGLDALGLIAPERGVVREHLLRRLCVYLAADLLLVVTAESLAGLDELLEVALVPVAEAQLQQLCLDPLILLGELLCRVDRELLIFPCRLVLRGPATLLQDILRDSVVHLAPECQHLLLEQLLQLDRKELIVLNLVLLRRLRRLDLLGMVRRGKLVVALVGAVGDGLALALADVDEPERQRRPAAVLSVDVA